ncbi:MAG TPA: serine/threonine-protein kinase [Polyangia bacterium]
MSSKTRHTAGIVLVLAAGAAGAAGFLARRADADRVAAAAGAVERAAVQGEAERLRLEQRAAGIAAMQPLQAALRDGQGGEAAPLQRVLDRAEWWKPVKGAFEAVRVISGAKVVAAEGPIDLGTADRDLVAAARLHGSASSALSMNGDLLLVAAVRIPALTGSFPVLVLAIPGDAALSARAADGSGESGGPIALIVAAALGALGLYVLFGGRPGGIVSGPGGIVSGVIKGETTLPFGATPGERPGAGLAQTPPPRPRTPPAQKARPSEKHAIGTSGTKLPRVLGRYTLLEHLGRGGMADVYIAASYGAQGFRRTFVLKRIRPELAQDKAAVGHFVDEACLQAGLVHSNIVPVFDFGIVDGEYFMTEEYVLGRDLARLTERHAEQNTQPFDPRLAFYVARETLQALDYAHTRQDKEGRPLAIVHRDVSPGNIMVSLAGDVKLFDFGIMKSNKRISQTQFGMVKGNANFMSPEQARGQEVDWRSDLFSLGLVLYYCLAGRLLYQGENDLELIHLAASGPSEADWEEIRKLPQPAPEILTRALAVDRNDRFQSAAEFSQALAPYVRHARSETADLMQTLFGEDLRREAA